jgi:unsaturated rhamnogalacturonyl hydrolase
VVIGSEIASGCRNVFVENCTMDSPNLDRALRFKSNAVRGGTIENIFMRNVQIGRVAEAIVTVDFLYEEGAKGAFMPTVRHVSLENITSKSSPRVFFVVGFPGAIIDDIRVVNSTFAGVTASDIIHHAGRIFLENVSVEPAQKARSLNSVTAPAAPAAH